ncbi:AAA domain-containing protein [Amycolatopsis xylanica]|uniref:AAA domain-containing protein n=1 Tax=Amycolatopsis xylanica TaxID=589385 RepID=A0A1H3RHI4_9PSEU|nr:AAA family ATPase [Amycolatopsis xylanica]SDZ24399.1 AAA domain-containing protein [Amycolatopsis xylanica]
MKSEIRPSQLTELRERVLKQNYRKYLRKVHITRLRALTDATVSFDFPVTAIVGPNGGGKTTVIGAAACAYKSILPRRFFAKSGKFDNSMADWQAEYEILDRDFPQGVIQRTASFKSVRWRRDAPDRVVLVFGVSRTVPANERPELQRCASPSFSVPEINIKNLSVDTVHAVGKILGKDISSFSQMSIDEQGRVSLLAGVNGVGESYSEFHFGAGESSVIRMIAEIEQAPDYSMALIEEIENGLHPVATRKMVDYLIDVASRKKIQVIFTTHSEGALEALPDYAVWAALDGRVQQGKLDIEALRSITGNVDSRLVLYVEDDFARDWVETCLRYYGNVALDAIQVHKMNGSSTAVQVQRARMEDPSISVESFCYLDGDAAEDEDENSHIVKLPGSSPELHVFNTVLDAAEELAPKIALALHLPTSQQAEVLRISKEVAMSNRDPHLLFVQIGDRLGFIAESIARSAFLSIWAQHVPSEVESIVEKIGEFLPVSGPRAPLLS